MKLFLMTAVLLSVGMTHAAVLVQTTGDRDSIFDPVTFGGDACDDMMKSDKVKIAAFKKFEKQKTAVGYTIVGEGDVKCTITFDTGNVIQDRELSVAAMAEGDRLGDKAVYLCANTK